MSHKNRPDNSWEDSSGPAFPSCHLCARPCAWPPGRRSRGAVKGQPGYSYAPPAPLGTVCCLYFQLRRGENMFLVVVYPAEHRHHRGSSHSTALSGTARNHPAHLTGCRLSFSLFHLGLARPCGCCFRLRCLLTPHLPGIPSKTLGAP